VTTASRRAPTRGTEAEGARLSAQREMTDSPSESVISDISSADADLGQMAAATLTRARDHLLGLQDPRGWWIGELETNVTMDAEDVLLRHFLGILGETDLKETAAWIRSQQRDDGTWANFYGGPGDLSTTVEAYVALRLAGDPVDAPHMKTAADWITGRGGVTATRVFTRMWLALSGLWDWDALPVIPPEVIYLPSWFPLNIYDWGCWARQTIVALAVVSSHRPVRPIPFGLDELHSGEPPKRCRPLTWGWAFEQADRVLQLYVRRPLRPLQRPHRQPPRRQRPSPPPVRRLLPHRPRPRPCPTRVTWPG